MTIFKRVHVYGFPDLDSFAVPFQGFSVAYTDTPMHGQGWCSQCCMSPLNSQKGFTAFYQSYSMMETYSITARFWHAVYPNGKAWGLTRGKPRVLPRRFAPRFATIRAYKRQPARCRGGQSSTHSFNLLIFNKEIIIWKLCPVSYCETKTRKRRHPGTTTYLVDLRRDVCSGLKIEPALL